jgi:hypothetical protein
MIVLFINSTHVSNTTNSQYTIKFPSGGVSFKNKQIAIRSITIPYSCFNITSQYGNNQFGYYLKGTFYPVVLADGFYSMDSINAFFQSVMYSNGHYLVDNTGTVKYYAQLVTNPNYYRTQYIADPIPTSLPTNYTNPANVLYNTVTFSTPTTIQLSIPANAFRQISGFDTGSYPVTPQGATYSVLSQNIPNATPVNSYIIRCSGVNNRENMMPDALYSFSPNTTFGNNINIQNSSLAFIDLTDNNYSQLVFTISDQNFYPIVLQDPNLLIEVLIKDKSE